MRRALAGLTTRGRSFVAAGATAIVCAYALGERDLLRAGVLVLVLPLLCTVAVARTRYRLACARRLTPARLPVGHEARVDLRLENVSRLPSGLLMVEDRVPHALGGRARFLLDRIESHGSRELSYRIRSEARGRFRVGPLTVRLADPFGMVELARSFSQAGTLTVTPEIVALPAGRLSGAWTGGGDSLARTVSTAGEDDVAPREYRHGDDLRRVHWRSTARHGELMVRREEQHWQSSGTLFLDRRQMAYWGEGPGSPFEHAVSATASIGVHLDRAGMGLRLVTEAGEKLPRTVASEGAFESTLLDALAVARTTRGGSLVPGLAALREQAAHGRDGDGLVVAVFGTLRDEEARAVAAARRGTATYVAVLIDTPTGTWSTTSTTSPGRAAAPDNAALPGGAASRQGAASPGHATSPAGAGSHGGAGLPGGAGDGGLSPESARAARTLRAAGWRVMVVATLADLAREWAVAAESGEDYARGMS